MIISVTERSDFQLLLDRVFFKNFLLWKFSIQTKVDNGVMSYYHLATIVINVLPTIYILVLSPLIIGTLRNYTIEVCENTVKAREDGE